MPRNILIGVGPEARRDNARVRPIPGAAAPSLRFCPDTELIGDEPGCSGTRDSRNDLFHFTLPSPDVVAVDDSMELSANPRPIQARR